LTLLNYYLGPIDWPGANNPLVFIYVCLCLFAFNFGFNTFSYINPGLSIKMDKFISTKSVFTSLFIIILYIIVDMYYFYSISGQSILSNNIFSNSTSLYNNYVLGIIEGNIRSNYDTVLLIIKSILYMSILVIFVNNFYNKKILFLCIFAMLIGTIARGTNKEVLDIIILIGLVSYYFGKRKQFLFITIIGGIIFIYLFYFLISQRYLNGINMCSSVSGTCIDQNTVIYNFFPALVETHFILSSYINQGYEGLSKAFFLEYEFSTGVSHLPVLHKFVCSSQNCEATFQVELSKIGWDTRYYWPSVYVYIANDFHWIFSPIYFFFLGGTYRWLDLSWKRHKNAGALIGIYLIIIFWIYSSANMQVAGSLPMFCAWIFFVYFPFIFYFLRAGMKIYQ